MNAAAVSAPRQRGRIERLCRYITRPVLALERLSTNGAGQVAARAAPMTRMQRLRRAFAIDLSICPDCGGRLRVIADVTRPDVIQRIREHVARQQAPPEFSAISGMATVH